MKLPIGILTLVATTHLAMTVPTAAYGQWYLNPRNQANAGGNGFTNGLMNGGGVVPGAGAAGAAGAALLPGNGILPGNPILPGSGTTGVTPGQTAPATEAAQAADTGDDGGGGGGGGGGFSYTSDPVSAETTAVYSGMANLIRSEGQYNRQTSKALINYEQARTLYIDNQEKLYNARRSIFRAKLSARAEDTEYAHANDARAEAFMASHRPLPLASPQLNPSTGEIVWPAALMAAEFDESRKALDSVFHERATSVGTSSQYIQMKQRVHEMKEILHEQVLKMPLENYSQARAFLDQLGASFH